MNLESLRSLQMRIREATGPDRELDCLIAAAVSGGDLHPTSDLSGIIGSGIYVRVPSYTTDPDGLGPCVALMRMLLPGYRREVFERWGYEDGRGWFIAECLVKIQGPSDTRPVNVDLHALETHATLLGIFSALIAQEEAKHTEKAG